MTAVNFPASLGGSGKTYSDDNNPTTGLGDDGHRERLMPLFQDVIAVTQTAKDKAQDAANSAASAANAPGTNATIASITIPAATGGLLAFTLEQAGKAYALGQSLNIYVSSGNLAVGVLEAFNAATGVGQLRVRYREGTATGAATVSLSPPVDASLSGRVSAIETEDARLKARRRLMHKELL